MRLGNRGHGALLGVAFAELGLRRVVAYRDAQRTVRSAAVRWRHASGGHLVQIELFRGEWIDELVFAILADEWAAR